MWSLNYNSILASACKQSDCIQRAAHGEGSQIRKFASSNGSPRIMGLALKGCIAVHQKSDGECSRWVPRLVKAIHKKHLLCNNIFDAYEELDNLKEEFVSSPVVCTSYLTALSCSITFIDGMKTLPDIFKIDSL